MLNLVLSGPERNRLISALIVMSVGQLSVLISLTRAVAALRADASPAQAGFVFIVGIGATMWGHLEAGRLATAALSREIGNRQRRLVAAVRRVDVTTLESIGAERIRLCMGADATRALEGAQRVVMVSGAILAGLGALAYGLVAQISGLAVMVLLALLCGPFILAATRAVHEEQVAYDRERQSLLTRAAELLGGFAQVKVHRARNDDMATEFDRRVDALPARAGAMYQARHGAAAINQALLFALIGLITLGFAHAVHDVETTTDQLVISAFYLFEPLAHLVTDQLGLVRAGAALGRLEEVLAQLESACHPTDPDEGRRTPCFARIDWRGARFTYPASAGDVGFSVGPIDLSVERGQVVFVTGANGSGKSTLLRMLTGLLRLDSGVIEVDGVPMSATAPDFRGLFSVIFAEHVLFDRLYGREDIDRARVRGLLEKLELQDVVDFDGGCFSTTELSTGQRKRLSMAIACLQDRPVMIFDEWAADQDPRFKRAFYEHWIPAFLAEGKTVIAVTHDDRWFDIADVRLHLDQGRS